MIPSGPKFDISMASKGFSESSGSFELEVATVLFKPVVIGNLALSFGFFKNLEEDGLIGVLTSLRGKGLKGDEGKDSSEEDLESNSSEEDLEDNFSKAFFELFLLELDVVSSVSSFFCLDFGSTNFVGVFVKAASSSKWS